MNLNKSIRVNQKLNCLNFNDINITTRKFNNRKGNKGYNFMAFSMGEESVDKPRYKRYYGVAPVSILKVNPTDKELNNIYGRDDMVARQYVDTQRTMDDKEVPRAAVEFVTITDETTVGVANLNRIVFYVTKSPLVNRDKTKVKVIDKYTRTAWVTNEEFKAKKVPIYSNGPADIDAGSYRPVYRGEEELTIFLRAFLGIQDARIWNDNLKKFVQNPDMSKCECILDEVDKLFKGDFSEIKAMVNARPDNKVKVMFGIRTTPDNRIFSDAYKECFLKYSARLNKTTNSYPQFEKSLKENAGDSRYNMTDFCTGPYQEYIEAPSTIEVAEKVIPAESNPFANSQPVATQTDDLPFSESIPSADKFPWE